ncbi:hypothetical protein Pla52o_07320 [Novipirellula galeiformis]|uniref:Uncharacterized protein n=1 Tax=Novipirellula galeiformis TaxID=2528004 RepID=A0A5C6CTK9_9BACT|nr:hypothetical protein [Novipirellula galeiformis]TWU26877.1 hypothetical protein Pla52o_07320 [Novipirellula galeiformis]
MRSVWGILFIGFASYTVSESSVAFGDEQRGDPADAVSQPIVISDLPSPPAAIASLIERGNVRFIYGPRPDSMQSPWQEDSRLARLRRGRRLAATTEYRLEYHFRSRNQWEFEDRGEDVRDLRISVWFTEARIEREHTVWFRQCPEFESFWTNRLVLHELDHVQISVDPGLEQRFRERLHSPTTIKRQFKRNETVDEAVVHRIVEAHVAEMFAPISDLVKIRYQELDRITDHGLLDFPPPTSIQTVKQWTPER